MLPPACTIRSSTPCLLVSGFRWSFYGTSDVNVTVSVSMTLGSLWVPGGGRWISGQGIVEKLAVR